MENEQGAAHACWKANATPGTPPTKKEGKRNSVRSMFDFENFKEKRKKKKNVDKFPDTDTDMY